MLFTLLGDLTNQATYMNKIKYLAAIVIAGFGLQQAKAFESDLTVGNSAISGFAGPYGHVSISLDVATQTATVTFTSNTVNGNIYLFGDGGSVALNVNAASFTVGTITGTNSLGGAFTPGPFSVSNNGAEDGFGMFNLNINSFDGFTHSSSTITFTLTNTSGVGWLTQADVVTLNSQGFDAAAHIFVTSVANPTGALATGFAGEGPGTPAVPDGGATVMLLGAALGALGMVRRYLKR